MIGLQILGYSIAKIHYFMHSECLVFPDFLAFICPTPFNNREGSPLAHILTWSKNKA